MKETTLDEQERQEAERDKLFGEIEWHCAGLVEKIAGKVDLPEDEIQQAIADYFM